MKKYIHPNDVSQTALLRAARQAVAGAVTGEFPLDPLVEPELSRAMSCIGSVVKRHGKLIEMGIAGALAMNEKACPRHHPTPPQGQARGQCRQPVARLEHAQPARHAAAIGGIGRARGNRGRSCRHICPAIGCDKRDGAIGCIGRCGYDGRGHGLPLWACGNRRMTKRIRARDGIWPVL